MSGHSKALATLVAITTLGAFGTTAAVAASADPVVHTDRGAVRGLAEQDTRTFRGIPYAAPPTGDLRWRSPRPAAA